MQKRNHQTEVQSKENNKSQVGKLKLASASALLLSVIALTGIAMSPVVATQSALTNRSQAHSISIQLTPDGACNPGPNC